MQTFKVIPKHTHDDDINPLILFVGQYIYWTQTCRLWTQIHGDECDCYDDA